MKGLSGGLSGRRQRLLAIAVVPVAALAVLGSVHGSSAAGVSFHTDYVDPARGGGEPFVIYSHAGHDLVFSSHEGTTLTQSSNVTGGTNCDINVGDPLNSGGYICTYDNQVNIWSSSDGGNTWQHQLGNPTATGFSDPSLTEDECTSSGQCNIYDTGIDLANDAMFASPDGGNTWAAGTAQCHDGDRPWLAGGKYDEGFLATNTEESGHTIFHATVTQDPITHQNVSLTCSTTGIGDSGGQGQIYYNHHDGNLLEPKVVNNHYGIGVLPNASAFNTTFIDRTANGPAFGPGRLSHWPAIAISTDTSAAAPNGTVYIVWDTAPRDSTTTNGCSGATGSAIGGATLLQNAVYLAYSNDEGQTWSQPITIANSGGTVQWPWVAAGANGNVSVVWYQANQVTDPDCDSANLVCTAAGSSCPTQWSIAEENLYGVTSGSPTTERVNVVQDPVPGASTSNPHPNGTIHVGKVCEGGTTCAATGEDRRLGDYFTNALDQNGCVMIASGDTMQNDPTTGMPLPNSLPIFAKQVSGPSLTTGQDCSLVAAPVPEAGTIIGLVGAGAVGALLVTQVRRRRRSRTALN